MKKRLIVIFSLLLAAGTGLRGQEILDRPQPLEVPVARGRLSLEQMLQRADSLHAAFRFQEAIGLYMSISGADLSAHAREELDRKVAASQNGLNMTDFCATPHVVARQRFSRKDFFLFYPLGQRAWHPSPNPLDSLSEYPLYYPKDAKAVYFSALDKAGTRSLFVTEDRDSLWSAPRLLSEGVTSTGSEIFPMLSPDGNTLYFASDGLFGMGGFDLYSCTWDPETQGWGSPVNLGFPFSSPGDDFLLMDTPDGKYTLFASNRECSRDSVYVYVVEYEKNRARKAVRSYEELRQIVSLRPENNPSRIDNASAVSGGVTDNANTRLYMRKNQEARAIRDSLDSYQKAIDALRTRVARAHEDETAALTASIRDKEQAMAPLRVLLEETELEIRLVEQSFLQSGVVQQGGNEAREVVGSSSGYTFARNAIGPRFKMKLEKPASRPYFRVSPIGRFAQDNTLPAGLVYQIELFSSPRHASVEDLGGLSPVYERLTSNLRYTYSVGLYPTYDAALSDLNVVRLLGFPDARIVAFHDGRPALR